MKQAKFTFWATSPYRLQVKMTIEGIEEDSIRLVLPRWRPGRYELGGFERNIRRVKFTTPDGNPIPAKKISRNEWLVPTEDLSTLICTYEYYASELNAGSTYVDDSLLLITFVNCCLYVPDKEYPVEVDLNIPTSWKAVSTLTEREGNAWFAKDIDELFDSALLASPSLVRHTFHVDDLFVGINFAGVFESIPINQISKDIETIIKEAFSIFGHFPTQDFEFLYLIPPYRRYHGVEHLRGTVIMLGPAHHLFSSRLSGEFYTYKHFLGVSAHEFFHVWNVKSIKPQEFEQLNYASEVYTEMGFFLEGVTTYYGELLLLRTGLISLNTWAEDFSRILTRFFQNYGRFNKSLAESSFDLWIDGYSQHIPHRTTSIYTHGALVTFLLDIHLRLETNNRYSFDHLMCYLYHNYALKGKGFTEEDLVNILGQWGGEKLKKLFRKYVFTMSDIEDDLKEALARIGTNMIKIPAEPYSSLLGFKVSQTGKVTYMLPGISATTELAYGDHIIGVENILPDPSEIKHWLNYFVDHKREIVLIVKRANRELRVKVPVSSAPLIYNYIVTVEEATELRHNWLKSLQTQQICV
ncbi:MAG: M61 family metallopeptidase [Chlorobi bacterium]|nr:M61 family metallopeptidase [Chlorobiota bacterium]